MKLSKITVLASIAVTLSSCGQGSAPKSDEVTQANISEPSLTPFEFRGLKPNVTTVAESRKAGTVKECGAEVMEETSCKFASHKVGDVPIFGDLSIVTFRDGKFDKFSIVTRSEDYDRLHRTLMSVYPKPCSFTSDPGRGVQWCFTEGTLNLEAVSPTAKVDGFGSLEFFSRHAIDGGKPIPKVTTDSI